MKGQTMEKIHMVCLYQMLEICLRMVVVIGVFHWVLSLLATTIRKEKSSLLKMEVSDLIDNVVYRNVSSEGYEVLLN